MKHFFIILILVFSNDYSNGQSIHHEKIKELRKQISSAKDDSEKVNLLDNLAFQLLATDSFDAMLSIANTEHNLSVKINYTYGILLSLWRYSCYYTLYKKDYPKASNYLKTAVEIIEKSDIDIEPRVENLVNYNILNHFFMVGDFSYAMKIVAKRISRYEAIKNKPMVARYNSLIGFIFLRQGRANDSKKYYRIFLQAEKELNDTSVIADAYNCMADVYVLEKKYDSALINNSSALAIFKMMSVHYSTLLLQGIYKWQRIAYTEFKTGNTYKLAHDYKKASEHTMNAITITREIQTAHQYDIAAYYINAGDIYKELKNYDKALKYFDTGLAISKNIEHAENIRDAYNYLAQTFSLLRKYDSAYVYYLLYDKLRDSISNEKISSEIEQIHSGYEVEKKDNEIVLLNQKNKLRDATIARQILTRNISIGATFLISILLLLLYNSRQLRQKNKFQTELNRQRNELFNTVITTQEKERKRIAQDLHDGLGSVLSAAKLKLSELEESYSTAGPQKEKYFTTLTLLDEAATELRNIAHNIMPATLAKIGLVAALQSIFDNISSYSGLHIIFSAYGFESRLNEETEVSIYRIILELVNNVVKHAKATEVTVQLVKHPAYISITVEDNGVGFNYDQVMRKANGIGLNNIASRVDYLQGTIDFESGKGSGTMVLINIPYQ